MLTKYVLVHECVQVAHQILHTVLPRPKLTRKYSSLDSLNNYRSHITGMEARHLLAAEGGRSLIRCDRISSLTDRPA